MMYKSLILIENKGRYGEVEKIYLRNNIYDNCVITIYFVISTETISVTII